MTKTDSTSPQDNASHGVEVQRRVRHWSVTVTVQGMDVVTIESNGLSGLENVTDFRPEIIEAAEHLLAFIGTGAEVFEFEDMPNDALSGPRGGEGAPNQTHSATRPDGSLK